MVASPVITNSTAAEQENDESVSDRQQNIGWTTRVNRDTKRSQ